MRHALEFAIRHARSRQRDPQSIWRNVIARLGQAEAQKLNDYLREMKRKDAEIDVGAARSADWRWALGALLCAEAVIEWLVSGFPVVVIRDLSLALELANTDPPTWLLTSPHGEDEYSALAVEIGDVHAIAIVLNWRDGQATWIGRNIVEEPYGTERGRVPFSPEQERRLIANVGFLVSQRSEGVDGLEVDERLPSPKAMRKQGRRYFPKVEYIIQAPRLLHPEPTGVERGPREEGWTLSVRTEVRGHWRQQAHGPGHSLRKPIWIRPHRRGPEDAPVSIHPIKLRKKS